MYEEIIKGQQLRATIEKLSIEYQELKKPIITDLTLLPQIRELIEEKTTTKHTRVICYFVPVVVLLYSPRCFLGQSMHRGLRKEIARTLNLDNPTSISHTLSTVSGWLTYNKEFRAIVNELYDAVTEELLG